MRFLASFAFTLFVCVPLAVAQDIRFPQVPPTPYATLPIINHYRFQEGEELIPGPTPTPFISTEKIKELYRAKMEEVIKNPPDIEPELRKAYSIPPNISKCFEDSSEDFSMGEKFPEGIDGEKSPLFDMLYIDSKELPEDYATIFGEGTIVIPYLKDEPNIGWSMIHEMNVPCVPYRVRFQGSKVYKDTGLPALKNYSKGPKGEYHPFVKSRYGIK